MSIMFNLTGIYIGQTVVLIPWEARQDTTCL